MINPHVCLIIAASELSFGIFFFHGATAPSGPMALIIVEALRSHSDTPHSVGLLWISDQIDAEESSALQHRTPTRDPCPRGIRTGNPSKPAAADQRLRPRGHRDRPVGKYCLK